MERPTNKQRDSFQKFRGQTGVSGTEIYFEKLSNFISVNTKLSMDIPKVIQKDYHIRSDTEHTKIYYPAVIQRAGPAGQYPPEKSDEQNSRNYLLRETTRTVRKGRLYPRQPCYPY